MTRFQHIGEIRTDAQGNFYLVIERPVVYRSQSEFAAWFTEWELHPGTYLVHLTRYERASHTNRWQGGLREVGLEEAEYPYVTVLGTIRAGDNASRLGGVVVGQNTIRERIGEVEHVTIYTGKDVLREAQAAALV